MHPQVRLPGPGKYPICGMDLVPVEQLTSERARIEQTAGVETEVVGYRELMKEVRTVGKLDYNEARVAYITARVAGRVDRIHADFTVSCFPKVCPLFGLKGVGELAPPCGRQYPPTGVPTCPTIR